MNAEAQRIAIAEACGIVTKDQWGPLYRTQHGIVRDCPNYVTDLNAMHEAEKVLRDEQWTDYYDNLLDTTKPSFVLRDITHATAAQRAEAFLRTLGKWEDDK